MTNRYPGDPEARDGFRCTICGVTYEAKHGSAARVVDRDHADLRDCVRTLGQIAVSLQDAAKRAAREAKKRA